MRTLAAVVLLALAAAPAAAQDLPRVEVRLATPDTPVRPLEGFLDVPGEVVVPCAFLAGTTPVRVDVGVVASPAWTSVSPSPASLFANGLQCTPPAATLPFRLLVGATQDAPAFVPGELGVEAVVRAVSGDERGEATTLVAADYFCLLDVSVEPSLRRVPERADATFALRVANHGNANTKASFEVADAPEGWRVQVPVPRTLESKQQGGASTSGDAEVVVVPRGEAESGLVQVRTLGAYALDATRTCREPVVTTVLVEVEEKSLPAGAPLVAVAAAAALARRAQAR